jgi:CHRD domain
MAHIHKGKAGENSPIVVTLFTSPSPTGKLNGNTTLVQGNLRADNLEGLLAGKHIPDLIKMIKDNDAYVNVHTAQNPKGEIRGQILSVSSSSATAAPQ